MAVIVSLVPINYNVYKTETETSFVTNSSSNHRNINTVVREGEKSFNKANPTR